MTIFDILFMASFLAVTGMVVTAAIAGLLGRRARALKVVRALAVYTGLYVGILIAVSLVSPRRVLDVGTAKCWDDWCVGVTGVDLIPAETTVTYAVTLRVSSRARGLPQRGLEPEVYVLDGQNRRHDPAVGLGRTPTEFTLQPEEAVTFTRVFQVPTDAEDPVLVLNPGGGGVQFPGWFIIGSENSLFHEPIVVPLT